MKKAKSKPAKVGRPAGRKPLLNLRIEQALHDRLKQSSERNGRTLSDEAVRRLEESFSSQNRNLLEALLLAIAEEPTWTDDGGRFFIIRPVIKRLMKDVIGQFIDSLPGPEYQRRDIEAVERDLKDQLDKIAERKAERDSGVRK